MYVTVQYMRAAAALSVLLFHILGYYWPWPGYFPYVLASGVDLFFIISGFIMVATTRSHFDLGRFAWARFCRVVPYWWIALLAYIVVRYLLTDYWPQVESIAQSALLIPHFNELSNDPVPILGPGWSLTNELVFYFIFGVTLSFSTGRPLLHLGSLFIVFTALAALRLLAAPDSAIGIRLTTPTFFEFLLGCAVAYYFDPITRYLKRIRLALLVCGLTVLGFINFLYFRDHLPRVLIFGLPFFLVFTGALLYEPEARRFELAFLKKLGDASYSLYLTHMLVLIVLERCGLFASLSALPGIIVATGISVAFALLAYAYVEKPLLTANRRLAFIRRPRASAQPAA